MSELVILKYMHSFIASHEGVTSRRFYELRLHHDATKFYFPQLPASSRLDTSFERPGGVLVPLPGTLMVSIYHLGVFEMVAGSRLDAWRSFFALE